MTKLIAFGTKRKLIVFYQKLLANLLICLTACTLQVAFADGPAPTGNVPSTGAYQIVLRSRNADATPYREKGAQTGGGAIEVEQPEPNTIVIRMTGSAASSSLGHGSKSGIRFHLLQDFEIVPTRSGIRAPRIGMVGKVVGTLQGTKDPRSHRQGGSSSATQGPASAWIAGSSGDTILSVDVENEVTCHGGEKSINHRCGPVEILTEAGAYQLTSDFEIATQQSSDLLYHRYAVADFAPAPQFDPLWRDALKPFRAVPRKDFGYTLVVRVVEDSGTSE